MLRKASIYLAPLNIKQLSKLFSFKKFRGKKIMEYHIIRYQERNTKKMKFIQVIATDVDSALGVFRRLVTDYIDDSPTYITLEEYKQIRENLGLNPDGEDESETNPVKKKFLEIAQSKEWRDYYASGGYAD